MENIHSNTINRNIFEELKNKEEEVLFPYIQANTAIKEKNILLINNKNKNNYLLIAEIIENIHANKPNIYNPILIKGKNETSKTFILENIQKILGAKAFSIHAKEILLQIKDKNDISIFLKTMENYNCIIIDDIHYLANDVILEEEFTYLIELFNKQNKTVIMSLNTEVKNKELSKELFARISMGLIILLPEPDLDLRMQYVQLCLEEFGIKINKDLALFIARRCFYYRQIKSAIINIKTFYKQVQYSPNIHDLERILQETGNSINLDYEYIINTVGKHFGFTIKEIKSTKRDQRLIEARQISMYLARKLLGDTYEKIGKNFNGRDHKTVIYSIRKIEEIIVSNKVMHKTVTELSNLCKT